METLGLGLAVGVGLALSAVQTAAQRKLLRSPRLAADTDAPFVSVLKPRREVDADLTENLRSIFRQAYPAFEVLPSAHARCEPGPRA